MTLKKLLNFRILLLFIIIVTNVYSFPLQYKVALDLFYLFFCFGKKIEKLEKNYIMGGAIFLLVYVIIVSIINGTAELYTIGKPLRFIFAMFIYIMYSNYFKKCSYNEIFYTVIAALSVHLLTVYAETINPALKPIVYSFLDEYKDDTLAASFRAFGLCASFDEAGLILCVLVVLFGIAYRKTNTLLFFVFELLAFVGCFMVGRTAMLLSSLLILLDLFGIFIKHKVISIFVVIPILAYIGYHGFVYAMDIIEATNMRDSYSESSANLLTGRMLYYPDSLFGWLFGTGKDAEASDIGYIKLLHQVGIIGSLFIFHMYYLTNRHLRKYHQLNPKAYYFMTMFVLMLFFYNYKGLFLYARGTNDLYFLLYFILLRKLSYENNQIRRVL